jgi:hypothetical protein
MAFIECASAQRGIPSVFVEVDHITDAQVHRARRRLDQLVEGEGQISTAVARAFLEVAAECPYANPSDLWQHVIYRHLISSGWSDNRWKRVSGFALERALVELYGPRLQPHGIRMRILPEATANGLLRALGVTDIRAMKVDLFLDGKVGDTWRVFGAAHVKSSIAERIQDDVPASRTFMEKGLLSIALTMDSKSYPPPHGSGINYGELGARSFGIERERLKRNYIEVDGQFDGMFSFNLRTPPSPPNTISGKRIYTMSFHEGQPDQLVSFLLERWTDHITNLTV